MNRFIGFFCLLAAVLSPVALAENAGSVALWTPPTETEGKKLEPNSAAHKLALFKGEKLKGRVARLDPKGIIPPRILAALKKGAGVELPTGAAEKLQGIINLVQEEKSGWVRVGGLLKGARKGSFSFSTSGKTTGGRILLPDEGIAYVIEQERDGQLLLRELALSEVICQPLPPAPSEPLKTTAAGVVQAPPLLSSRPAATAVLYLDFDGETVTDPDWNGGVPIVAAAPDLTSFEITQIWERVKEDLWPFNIDVTTNVSRYNSAPVGSRMRCIVTPTDTAAPGAGGVAYLNSFALAGQAGFSATIPCWVFNSSIIGIAEAASHEFGHTFGLRHDGGTVANSRTSADGTYYYGYSSPSPTWGTIMGAAYDQEVVQWSKGEYDIANNTENDLAIIANSTNGFGYVADEAGETIAAAANLPAPGGFVSFSGVIAAADVDCYRIEAGNGTISLDINPAFNSPNLDVSAELLNAGGIVLASSGSNQPSLDASLSRAVTQGTYFLRIRGSAWGNPATGGWSTYGSIGEYSVTGSVPNFIPVDPPVITSGTTAGGFVGFPFSYAIVATNSPSNFSVTGSLPPGITLNSSSGLLSGTPSVEGVYSVTINATNSVGTDSQPLVITIQSSEDFDLGEAVDATDYEWTTEGDAAWFPQTVTKSDGEDAAQSGIIGHNQSSSLEVPVTGPATVSFRWKTDSEAGKDYLNFFIDGQFQNRISGKSDWALRSYTVGSGTHILKWTYTKDYSVSVGTDAGWVDTFALTTAQAPAITSPDAAAGTVGQLFSYQITADNSPTSYAFSGSMPPGLSLNGSTGKISGTPSAIGVFALTLSATNASGTGLAPLTITISDSALSLAEAVDATDLVWTSGGEAVWKAQTDTAFDATDAAQSGKLTGNNQQSWIQTTVTGPSTISFRWKVDSESGDDFLRFKMDGIAQASVSGEVGWQQRTFPIPAGSHVLRWSYEKDETVSVGADAAWLDTVTFGVQGTRVIALSGSMAFGNVPVGDSAQRALTISNTGDQTLTVSSISYPAAFSGNWSGTIPAGESQVVPVTFAPTAATSFSGTITVNSNATDGTNTLAVSGAGVASGGALVSAQDLPKAIQDRKTITSSITVSGKPASMSLNQIKLSLGLTHTFIGDLIIKVKPPKGAELTIRKRAGGDANDLVITSEALPSSKTINPNGVWKLSIEDKKNNDQGTLQSWGLLFP